MWICVLYISLGITNTLPGVPESGFHGGIEASSGYNHVAEQLWLSGQASIRWHQNLYSAFLTSQGKYGKTADQEYQKSHFHHLRIRRQIIEILYVESFGQYESDPFRELKQRTLAGGGLRIEFFGAEKLKFAAGVASFYELESQQTGEVNGMRASFYGELHINFDYSKLSTIAFFQPRWGQIEDRRALIENSLQIKIAEYFSLRVSINASYDTRPPDGKSHWDVNTNESIVLTW